MTFIRITFSLLSFSFMKNWAFRKLWQKHIGNAHLVAYLKATEDIFESFIIDAMTLIA
jgi:hypothetical protein